MEELEFAANKWLKPYPNAVWRENVEVLLVAIAVAMGIRTFFIQPFKIPTGSMQPTLYGVTSEPDFSSGSSIGTAWMTRTKIQAEINSQLKLQQTMKIPTGLGAHSRIGFMAFPTFILSLRPMAVDGSVEDPGRLHFFPSTSTSNLPGRGTPFGFRRIMARNRWSIAPACAAKHESWSRVFHKGDDVIKLRVQAGDHLFVDRLTYNFRPPKRGEIVVFDTHGITSLPARSAGHLLHQTPGGTGRRNLVAQTGL